MQCIADQWNGSASSRTGSFVADQDGWWLGMTTQSDAQLVNELEQTLAENWKHVGSILAEQEQFVSDRASILQIDIPHVNKLYTVLD